MGVATIHYSVNTSAPSNLCTGGVQVSNQPSGVLHVAIQAPTTGFVGLGFSPGQTMWNSDVSMGFVDSLGGSQVNQWAIPENYFYINSSNFISPSWALFSGVVQSPGLSGTTLTTMCFSRPLISPLATVSKNIQGGIINMIFSVAANGTTGFQV